MGADVSSGAVCTQMGVGGIVYRAYGAGVLRGRALLLLEVVFFAFDALVYWAGEVGSSPIDLLKDQNTMCDNFVVIVAVREGNDDGAV